MWKTLLGRVEKDADEGRRAKAVAQLEERIKSHEARIEALDSELATIRLEWATWYKKLQRMAGHVTKALALDAAAAEAARGGRRQRSVDDLSRDEIAALPLTSEHYVAYRNAPEGEDDA